MAVRIVRLGQLLAPALDICDVHAESIYPQIGMLNFGRGTFKKTDLRGAETKYKTLQRVRAGQAIYSKLKAFEGALSIVPTEYDQHFVSQEFPTFDINRNEIDPSYLLQVFRSEPFTDQLAQGSKGVGARRERLHPTAFLDIKIPLPSFEEQRRIIERVRRAEIPLSAAAIAASKIKLGIDSFLATTFQQLPRENALSEVLQQRNNRVSIDFGNKYATIGLSKSGRGAFVKTASQTKAASLWTLRPGDFVYSRLFAWQGSMAIVPETSEPLYASNEFPSFGIDRNRVLPHYLIGWLRLPRVWSEIEEQCTGSTPGSRNRFKEAALMRLKFPLPPISDQQLIANRLAALERASALADRRTKLAEALPKSVRNEIFSKLV